MLTAEWGIMELEMIQILKYQKGYFSNSWAQIKLSLVVREEKVWILLKAMFSNYLYLSYTLNIIILFPLKLQSKTNGSLC